MREHDTVESTNSNTDYTQEHTQDDNQPPRKRKRYYCNLLDRTFSRERRQFPPEDHKFTEILIKSSNDVYLCWVETDDEFNI